MVLANCGTCQQWRLLTVVPANRGACQQWCLPTVVPANCGACQLWCLPTVVPANCGTCQQWCRLTVVPACCKCVLKGRVVHWLLACGVCFYKVRLWCLMLALFLNLGVCSVAQDTIGHVRANPLTEVLHCGGHPCTVVTANGGAWLLYMCVERACRNLLACSAWFENVRLWCLEFVPAAPVLFVGPA